MINRLLVIVAITSFLPFCSPRKNIEIKKQWLNRTIDFGSIQEVTNTYWMYDSTRTKVGSMVISTSFKNGYLIARDTSQFDDGSVYETAEFTIDTSNFILKKMMMDIEVPQANVNVAIEYESGRVTGAFTIKQDTSQRVIPIDSSYQHDIVREELYILLQTFPFEVGDTLNVTAYVPTGMNISKATLNLFGRRKPPTRYRKFRMRCCDVEYGRSYA